MAFKLPTNREVTKRTNSNREKFANSLSKEENDIRLKQSQSFIGSSNDPFSTPTRDNYLTYPYDYFSGADCKVFFGDIWVDDIVGISYNLSQSKTPIYGYASQYFSAIAKGQVIVQGSLMIAFKETGYLNIIQATLESQRANASALIKAKIDKMTEEGKMGVATYTPGLNVIGEGKEGDQVSLNFSPNGSPQIIRQQQTIEKILADKKVNTSKVVGAALGVDNKTRDFEDFAEILEDSLWGDSNGHPIALTNKLKRADEFDYTPDGGINISRNGNYSNVLNIMLTFGDINDFRAEHTITILNDVHFTSVSTIVNPNGDPIGEEYSFIAKTVNDSINTQANVINIDPIKMQVGTDATISTLENVKAIEDYLLHNNINNQVELVVEAGVVQGDRWDTFKTSLGSYPLFFNNATPFVDQLCLFTENAVNSLVDNELNTKYFQFIITAYFGYKSSEEDLNNKITMILQQTAPNTKSYRVISPTRTGFSANNIISRDDLFNAKAMEPPLQEIPKVTEEAKKEASQAEAAAVKDKAQDESEFEEDKYLISAETRALIAKDREAVDPNRTINSLDVKQINERYGAEIARAKAQLNSKVPVEFVAAIIAQESAGNPNAKSTFLVYNKDGTLKKDKDGKQVYGHAEGLTQMIPSTYGNAIQNIQKEYPQAKITPVVGVYSPDNAILAATYELNRLYDLTGGDLEQVAAAYNGGPGAVKESRSEPGKKVYEAEVNKRYAETRKYVPSVMAGYQAGLEQSKVILQDAETNKQVIENERKRVIQERIQAEKTYEHNNWGIPTDTSYNNEYYSQQAKKIDADQRGNWDMTAPKEEPLLNADFTLNKVYAPKPDVIKQAIERQAQKATSEIFDKMNKSIPNTIDVSKTVDKIKKQPIAKPTVKDSVFKVSTISSGSTVVNFNSDKASSAQKQQYEIYKATDKILFNKLKAGELSFNDYAARQQELNNEYMNKINN